MIRGRGRGYTILEGLLIQMRLRDFVHSFKRLSWHHFFSSVLVVAGVGVSILMINVASQREVSSVESILFQVVILGTGLSGSFLFGRISAAGMVRDVIRPHARSAFRRVLSLQKVMHYLSIRIDEFQQEDYDPRLDVIRAVVDGQIVTGKYALEDWRDIIPNDVDEMLERYGEDDDSG